MIFPSFLVNPSTPRHKCQGLPFDKLKAPSTAEGSGLTLSGALYTALKGGAWRRRMGQVKNRWPEFYLAPTHYGFLIP